MSGPSSGISSSVREYRHDLTPSEARDLHNLVSTVGTKSKFWLMFNVPQLEGYKSKLGHVHPLTFIENVLKPELRFHLRGVISHGELVWKPFIENISKSLNEEASRDNLYCHLNEFSKQLGSTAEKVKIVSS
jgi:hypothetical protein